MKKRNYKQTIMASDYSNKNLQKSSFRNEDLRNSNFANSDLRGADFGGADLSGADFTHVKTGITPLNKGLIFLGALVVSLLSGYLAMLAGHTLQEMLSSPDGRIRTAGIVSIVVIVLFIGYALWKGVVIATKNLVLPAAFLALLTGLGYYLTGAGTGMGMVYLGLACFFVVIMFVVGTISRAAAGTLSTTILFLIVALGGGMFGKSLGGGIGTIVMALSCALISKRALHGAKGFETLKKIAAFISTTFGTSFRNSKMANVNFSQSKIQNADFSDTDLSSVNWGDSKKINCVFN